MKPLAIVSVRSQWHRAPSPRSLAPAPQVTAAMEARPQLRHSTDLAALPSTLQVVIKLVVLTHQLTVYLLGNVYIGDQYNHRVRKVTVVSTSSPRYLLSTSLFLYRRLTSTYFSNSPTRTPTSAPSSAAPTAYPSLSPSTAFIISTIAGTGTGSYSGDNGAATAAALFYPEGVAVDSSGTYLRGILSHFYSFSALRQHIHRRYP